MNSESENPVPVSTLETLRTISLIAEEGIRIQEIFHKAFIEPGGEGFPAAAPANALAPEPETQPPPTEDGDDVLNLMRDAQRLLFTHPIAAQKAFAALIEEGRKFAATESGQAWVTALQSSELLRKGHRMWSAITFDALEEQPTGALPSAYLELLLSFARTSEPDLDLWAEALNAHNAERIR